MQEQGAPFPFLETEVLSGGGYTNIDDIGHCSAKLGVSNPWTSERLQFLFLIGNPC